MWKHEYCMELQCSIFNYSDTAIFHSLISLWAAIHQDEDDIFDPSSFTVIQNFRGSFQMPNQVFTEELATSSSNKSQTLATELGTKVGPLITYIL